MPWMNFGYGLNNSLAVLQELTGSYKFHWMAWRSFAMRQSIHFIDPRENATAMTECFIQNRSYAYAITECLMR